MSLPGRIRQLDDAVANQIAAGEVVERPASVVKELVENAIDAEATRLRVEVEEGGTRRIRVTDDGYGMSRADAELCLSRHATSKIRSVEDLESVRTLGFRGEAVPSIASVSRFALTTRARGEDTGTRVVVEGGALVDVSEVGAPPGTTIDVADLFYNVPARKKFLKRPSTELSHISEGLIRLAMCRPQVGFRLATEHKVLLDVPPGVDSDPRGRLGRILGAKVAERLHPVVDDGRPHPVAVTGFAAEPGLSERGTKGLYTFVNGRFVRDRTIQHAVQDAYRTLLERGRYPVVVLFIELDPSTFDVNVHPQKTEVRFARTGDIHRAVAGALGRTLAAQPWLRGGAPAPAPAVRREVPMDGDAGSENDAFAEHAARAARARGLRTEGAGGADFGGGGLGRGASRYVPRPDLSGAFGRGPDPASPGFDPGLTPDGASPARDGGLGYRAGAHDGAESSLGLDPSTPSQLQARWSGRFSELEPVGQVLGTYLVCQGPGRMVLIDQHAAHERVTFQRMRTQSRAGALEIQPLLVPLALELDSSRAQAAEDSQADLQKLGFTLERLESGDWQVRAAPAALSGARLGRLVTDLLDELRDLPEAMALEERLDAMFSCAACHGSVRAQDRLQNDEIRALLAQMDQIDFGAFCPHGRPVFVEFDDKTLARLFHRS